MSISGASSPRDPGTPKQADGAPTGVYAHLLDGVDPNSIQDEHISTFVFEGTLPDQATALRMADILLQSSKPLLFCALVETLVRTSSFDHPPFKLHINTNAAARTIEAAADVCPALEKFQFVLDLNRQTDVDKPEIASALAHAICRNPQNLHRFVITGGHACLAPLTESLAGVTDLHLEWSMAGGNDAKDLSPFLTEQLRTSDNLTQLSIARSPMPIFWVPSADLGAVTFHLPKHRGLAKLELNHMPESAVGDVCAVLSSSRCLSELRLGGGIKHVEMLAKALKKTPSPIQILDLTFANDVDGSPLVNSLRKLKSPTSLALSCGSLDVDILAFLIEDTPSLEWMEVSVIATWDDADIAELLEALDKNTTLRHFVLEQNHRKWAPPELAPILERNRTRLLTLTSGFIEGGMYGATRSSPDMLHVGDVGLVAAKQVQGIKDPVKGIKEKLEYAGAALVTKGAYAEAVEKRGLDHGRWLLGAMNHGAIDQAAKRIIDLASLSITPDNKSLNAILEHPKAPELIAQLVNSDKGSAALLEIFSFRPDVANARLRAGEISCRGISWPLWIAATQGSTVWTKTLREVRVLEISDSHVDPLIKWLGGECTRDKLIERKLHKLDLRVHCSAAKLEKLALVLDTALRVNSKLTVELHSHGLPPDEQVDGLIDDMVKDYGERFEVTRSM